MPYLNRLQVIGQVPEIPITRTTNSGQMYCNLILKCQRPGKQGQALPEPYKIPCTSWGKTAEYLSMLPINSWVLCDGHIQTRNWTNQETKKVITFVEFNIDQFYRLNTGETQLSSQEADVNCVSGYPYDPDMPF